MKKYIVAFGVAMAVAFGPSLQAEDDHKQGGVISGVENVQARVIFAATTNAPEGATGILRLHGHDLNGTNRASVNIRTRGLSEGTYNVTATLKSDTNIVDLGQITLAGGTNTNAILVSISDFELTNTVSAADIAQVAINDTNSAALLIADLIAAPGNSVAMLNSRIRVLSDNTNTVVHGSAVLRTFAHKGKQNNHFVMVVHGLPTNTTLHLVVNDVEIGTVKTSKQGTVLIRKLNGQDLTLVHSVKLQDDTATTLAEADF